MDPVRDDEERLSRALALIDEANAQRPRDGVAGADESEELVYGRRMSAALERLVPAPSVALRIAVRAQHIERWRIPRSSYPQGRVGYLKWRTELARLHAKRASEILGAVGYDQKMIERVASIVQKRNLATDAEAQALEDCACLVFLEHELEEFAARHEEDKVIDILRKTWRKMSEGGRAAALELGLGERARELVTRALEPGGGAPGMRKAPEPAS